MMTTEDWDSLSYAEKNLIFFVLQEHVLAEFLECGMIV